MGVELPEDFFSALVGWAAELADEFLGTSVGEIFRVLVHAGLAIEFFAKGFDVELVLGLGAEESEGGGVEEIEGADEFGEVGDGEEPAGAEVGLSFAEAVGLIFGEGGNFSRVVGGVVGLEGVGRFLAILVVAEGVALGVGNRVEFDLSEVVEAERNFLGEELGDGHGGEELGLRKLAEVFAVEIGDLIEDDGGDGAFGADGV